MLFNSWEFIFLFLPLTLTIFFQINRRGHYQVAIGWLVLASLFFYGWWNPAYIKLIIFSILFNYLIGIFLNLEGKKSYRRLGLIFGLTVNLALIGYFKYANFFVSSVNDLAGTTFTLNKIILPLAISFFTFQQITYLVDSYKGETKDYGFLNYCLFVTFFPQLIAGPIVHHKEVMPQFADKSTYRFDWENLAVGLTVFCLGLFKKVVFADTIATFATPVFNEAAAGEAVTFFTAWGGALAYTLQLYFDFSGYSDMAIGAARMFGIKLPLNFNSPYKATSVIDFWRRWHITLSHFLRDYLYIPLGGSRQGKLRRNVNLMITMLLGGLWHGAGWTFIFWGGLHGMYLVINHQWHSFQKFLGHDPNKNNWWRHILGVAITFIAIVIGWVFFRAANMNAAFVMLRGMIGINGVALPIELAEYLRAIEGLGVTLNFERGSDLLLTYTLSLALLAVAWFTPNTQQWLEKYHPALGIEKINSWQHSFWQKLYWQPNGAFGFVLGGLIFVIAKIALEAPQSEFLYFDF
ncbi:MBOAT family protein [Myxosarcina sp. GI1]|uniref:MBOAT family O-acyltransferase n=1 Tax=Myxosarcina sp. GI1 TaxID=1541065 RepID=UPI00055FD615|nr:MBOAT family protein [Myxosarcina sp. GI1]